jgi:hypothetical protein
MTRMNAITPVLRYAAALFIPALLASCMPDFTKNIPCSNDNECPSGYYCLDLKCSKGTNPGTTEFTVAPVTLPFGEVQNGTSKSLTITVTNVAQSNAQIRVKAAIESGADVFAVTPADYVVVPPKSQSGMATFSVTFSPGVGQLGTFAGTVTFVEDQPWKTTPSKLTVNLTGLSTDPKFIYAPTDIDFNKDGDKTIEITINPDISYTKSITVQNQGTTDSTLTITDITLNDDYNKKLALASLPALPARLASGEQFVFNVVLYPKDTFNANTKVVIKSDDNDRLTGNVSVKAVVSNCNPGWYSTLDKPNCGCQTLSRGGAKCSAPEELKYLPEKPYLLDTDNTFIFVETANLVPNEEKWFTFGAEDDLVFEKLNGIDPFHVTVQLQQGVEYDENIVMEVYTVKDKTAKINMEYLCGSPPGPFGFCQDSQCGTMTLNLEKYNVGGINKQRVDFYVDTLEMGIDNKPIGECPCEINESALTPDPNKNFCRNDSQRFYIRVHRKEGSVTTCKQYKLSISNGFYAQSKCK